MGLKNGPSRIDHVPNFRITFIETDHTEEARVIVDRWKGRNFDIQGDLNFSGWTAFINYLPKSLDDALQI